VRGVGGAAADAEHEQAAAVLADRAQLGDALVAVGIGLILATISAVSFRCCVE
jgi:hypothetical protein